MSYWRPSPRNIYVIADLHGKYKSLLSILKRILPLKEKDEIIFLGDYVDRGPKSAHIIEKFIELKKEYGDRITFLLGNHELMMMETLGLVKTDLINNVELVWLQNGAPETIRSYASFLNLKDFSLSLDRFRQIVPDTHKEFLKSLKPFYETTNYIFSHAGFDPVNPDNNDLYVLLWDKSLYSYVINCIANERKLGWTKTIVTGHNFNGPIVYDKYMMLDTSKKKDVLCVELNSMEAYYASEDKGRLVKIDLKESSVEELVKQLSQ